MNNEELEQFIMETLGYLSEEDGQETQGNETSAGEETGEAFSAESIEDFLQKTDSKVTVKKEGCMPSPIFGNQDQNNHNKYRIFIENPNGKVSFVFWDSIANTKKGVPLDTNEALISFAKDIDAYQMDPSFENFKDAFGYSNTDVDLAQRAYNGCRKQMEKAQKIFTEEQIKELVRLASEE